MDDDSAVDLDLVCTGGDVEEELARFGLRKDAYTAQGVEVALDGVAQAGAVLG